jgi:hypothetical protein
MLPKAWAAGMTAIALIAGTFGCSTNTGATRVATVCTLSAKLVPSCGVLWGAYKPASAGETWQTTVTNLESQVGRPFDIVYRYHDFSGAGSNGAFPDSYEQSLAASGHLLMDNWQSLLYSNHVLIPWSSIAAGNYDASVIDPEALRIKAFGQPMFLAFDHEMDASVGAEGTAADFVAAYRHIHDEFARLGVTNVVWVWTVTGWSGHDSLYPSLYPGDAYVDWIGYDPYNFGSCHGNVWHSPSTVIDRFYQWLEANGYGNKPFMLPEYGTVTDPSNPNAAAQWYQQLPAALAAHPNIKAVDEFDTPFGRCNTSLTVGPGELAAFAVAGRASASRLSPKG